jgi:hypothetical protein
MSRAGHLLLFTIFTIRYSIFRYFKVSFCYRYSATFLKIAIFYLLFAITTFALSVLQTASFIWLFLQEKEAEPDKEHVPE